MLICALRGGADHLRLEVVEPVDRGRCSCPWPPPRTRAGPPTSSPCVATCSPARAVGSVVGLGGMAGAVGGMFISIVVGEILQRTGSYVPIFFIAGFAYLAALADHPPPGTEAGARAIPRNGDLEGMRPFIHDDFLLGSPVAHDLYVRFARDLPIVDYHCHLSPELIAADHRFRSHHGDLAGGRPLQVAGHARQRRARAARLRRRLGLGEVRGLGAHRARDAAQSAVPLDGHGAEAALRDRARSSTPATAREIFDRCNERLREDDFTTMGLLKSWKVAVVCTTDDPVDSLEAHRQLAARQGSRDTRVPHLAARPRARPSTIPEPGTSGSDRLEAAANRTVRTLQRPRCEALDTRHRAFHELGCRASDHGLETLPPPCRLCGRGGRDDVRFAARGAARSIAARPGACRPRSSTAWP